MLGGSIVSRYGWSYGRHMRRLLSFSLDGNKQLPTGAKPVFAEPLQLPGFAVDEALMEKGKAIYVASCGWCHGPGVMAGGGAPDLRASVLASDRDAFTAVVRDGQLAQRGMPAFSELNNEQLESLMHFVRKKAHAAVSN